MDEGVNKQFYQSILYIRERDFEKGQEAIRKFRKLVIQDLGSFGDYMGSYDKIMKMHQARELEEILLTLKEQQDINTNELSDFILGSEQKAELIREKRIKLLNAWEDRIHLIESNIDYWEMIISIRSLFASDIELVRTRRNFGKLCHKMDFHNVLKSTYNFLIEQKKNFELNLKSKPAQSRVTSAHE